MSLVLSVPSKSFFAGEYSALNGGPSITIATAPRFDLKVRPGSGWLNGIHKDSPAGKLIRKHPVFFNQFDLDFVDPHLGRGGWGASTAQFLACYALLQWQDSVLVEAERYFDSHQMLNTYKELAWNGKGLPPSGADLIGQFKGGITFFERRRGAITQLKWPFRDMDFYLIPTGFKVSTHEHLEGLTQFDSTAIESAVRKVEMGLTEENRTLVIEGVHEISKELDDRKWVHPKTADYLKQLNSIPGVLASKGCGALGADVVFVLVEKSKSVLFEALLKDDRKQYFTHHHVSQGLTVYADGDMKIERYTAEMMP